MKNTFKHFMKLKNTLVILAFILIQTISAQAPQKLSYQAVIRNANSELLNNTNVAIKISLLENSENGNAVYVETQNATTNANGLVSIKIGEGKIQSGSFDLIDWGNNSYFIKTQTDLTGGTNYSITGVSELMSVPYALYAKNGGQGLKGDIGLTGLTGSQGIQGLKGDIGLTGEKGDTGLVPTGGLKTIDGLELTNNLKVITDHLSNNSPLRMSLRSITNYGPGLVTTNTMFGNTAGYYNTTGSYNSFFGNGAGYFNRTGSFNIFIGYDAGRTNTTGSNNNFNGNSSGIFNTTGSYNEFLGSAAGTYNTTGNYNTFLGSGAGSSNVSGNGNVIIGSSSNPLTNNDSNEIIVGVSVTGAGSNTVTLGNIEIIKTILRGTLNAERLKVFDSNDSAKNLLKIGDIYRTSTGDLKIVF